MDLTELPSSRKEAVNLGSKYYCTGKPCSKGHTARRSVTNAACTVCKCMLRGSHESFLAYRRKYREANRESINEKDRGHREANRELFNERNREYYVANLEKERVRSRDYRKNNRGARNAGKARRRSSKLHATPKWLNKEQLLQIKALYEQAAYLTATSGEPHHVDHIIPLQGKIVCGLHVPWNLQVLTADENIRKNNRLLH